MINEPWPLVLQVASLATVCVCMVIVARANGQLRKVNASLRNEVWQAREFIAVLLGIVGPDAVRTCQACGQYMEDRHVAVIRHEGGTTRIGHAICFPPMLD